MAESEDGGGGFLGCGERRRSASAISQHWRVKGLRMRSLMKDLLDPCGHTSKMSVGFPLAISSCTGVVSVRQRTGVNSGCGSAK